MFGGTPKKSRRSSSTSCKARGCQDRISNGGRFCRKRGSLSAPVLEAVRLCTQTRAVGLTAKSERNQMFTAKTVRT